eukprot:m.132689 g.132689  ORF g.132689 m.132689 type:complete len:111 (+) comp29627_c1_seq1:241-573(+)
MNMNCPTVISSGIRNLFLSMFAISASFEPEYLSTITGNLVGYLVRILSASASRAAKSCLCLYVCDMVVVVVIVVVVVVVGLLLLVLLDDQLPLVPVVPFQSAFLPHLAWP